MKTTTADICLDARATLAESPVWSNSDHALHWVDIERCQVHTFYPESGDDSFVDVGQPVGTVVRRVGGGAMVGVRDGFAELDLATGELELIHDPEPGLASRFNDGKCDAVGRFWVGSAPTVTTFGSSCGLYCMSQDRSVRRVVGDVTVSNGLGWSPDSKTMYYVDTMLWGADAFDFDLETGDVTNRRPIFRCEDGTYTDGLTVDEEGMLWVARFGGGVINRWNPSTGKVIGRVEVPVPSVTSCTFGGPNLDRLYITSARLTLDDDTLRRYPQAGGIFVAEPGARGMAAFEFAG